MLYAVRNPIADEIKLMRDICVNEASLFYYRVRPDRDTDNIDIANHRVDNYFFQELKEIHYFKRKPSYSTKELAYLFTHPRNETNKAYSRRRIWPW
jgi:hypothetical protein